MLPSSSLSPPKAQKQWNSRSQRRQTNLKKAASSPSQTITDYYKFIDEFESQLFHFKTQNASLQLSLNAMEERL